MSKTVTQVLNQEEKIMVTTIMSNVLEFPTVHINLNQYSFIASLYR